MDFSPRQWEAHSPLPPPGRSDPQRACGGKLVTSGTGSSKSLCYFLPIVDHLLRCASAPQRVVALVVYPMNTLVNSQFQALQTLKEQYERRARNPFSIRFAKYTGETKDAERDDMRQKPPQILLTNYVMAEPLLVRPEDQRLLERVGSGLRFLVFDELHTYRGRQGADVAMLARRLKERCAAPHLVHVGTSATMVARGDATSIERRQSVADFVARFFAHSFGPDQVVERRSRRSPRVVRLQNSNCKRVCQRHYQRISTTSGAIPWCGGRSTSSESRRKQTAVSSAVCPGLFPKWRRSLPSWRVWSHSLAQAACGRCWCAGTPVTADGHPSAGVQTPSVHRPGAGPVRDARRQGAARVFPRRATTGW